MPTTLLLAHPDLKTQRHLCIGYFPNKSLIGILEHGHLFLPEGKVNADSYKMKILQEFFADESPFRKASEIYQLDHYFRIAVVICL